MAKNEIKLNNERQAELDNFDEEIRLLKEKKKARKKELEREQEVESLKIASDNYKKIESVLGEFDEKRFENFMTFLRNNRDRVLEKVDNNLMQNNM